MGCGMRKPKLPAKRFAVVDECGLIISVYVRAQKDAILTLKGHTPGWTIWEMSPRPDLGVSDGNRGIVYPGRAKKGKAKR